jgi:hypothetical protein
MTEMNWRGGLPKEPSNCPNPGGGFAVGIPHGSRPEGAMSVANNNGGDWHPTVVNLLVLLVLEVIGFALLRKVLSQAGI